MLPELLHAISTSRQWQPTYMHVNVHARPCQVLPDASAGLPVPDANGIVVR